MHLKYSAQNVTHSKEQLVLYIFIIKYRAASQNVKTQNNFTVFMRFGYSKDALN